jgi:hypothetical protein
MSYSAIQKVSTERSVIAAICEIPLPWVHLGVRVLEDKSGKTGIVEHDNQHVDY